MRLQVTFNSVLKRFKEHPFFWLLFITFALATSFPDFLLFILRIDNTHYSYGDEPFLFQFWLQIVDFSRIAILAPIAWQWTGDDQLIARPFRGICQNVLMLISSYFCFQWPVRIFLAQKAVYEPGWLFEDICTFFYLLVISSAVGYAIAVAEQRQALRKQTKAESDKAQWTLLRSQLSPHMVLNSLNGLAGLIEEDPDRAIVGLRDLRHVYEQLTELGQKERIPLGEERSLLESYLAVEALRLEARLRVVWDWDHALDILAIPPLLLQPLVENAIKHGISPYPDGGTIEIRALRQHGQLLLQVRNTGGHPEAFCSTSGTGIGVSNLERRLELTYGDKATFSLEHEEGWTCAEIRLPDQTPQK